MSDQPKKILVVVIHGPNCPALRAATPPAATGPSKVATDAYRTGWEGIFGAREQRGEA